EELTFGPKNIGFSGNKTKSRVEKIAKMTNIYNLLDLNPRRLNFFQKQWVAIAASFPIAGSVNVSVYIISI
ncbi:unnamed protein product, partial [marine sediment metagenome]